MLPQIHSAIPPNSFVYFLVIIGFGVYHGLNPAMGWLFALSLGLQQKNGRVIWISLFPIAAGHAASVILVAIVIFLGIQFISLKVFQILTAVVLLIFGIYKLFRYYRHPRWVGMQVGIRDLFVWSFLMATGHGAGLMLAPSLIGIANEYCSPGVDTYPGIGLLLAVVVHTLAMFSMMGAVAWIVYNKLSLSVLRHKWINFDLIWAVALLFVGVISLFLTT